MRKLSSIVLLAALYVAGCEAPPEPAEEFSGNWREPTGEVMRTLASNGIEGCGEFYQKESTTSANTFAVACTRDQRIWKAYMVWPAIDEVMGPDDMFLVKLGGPPFGIDVNGKRVEFSEIE